jgi:cell division transport system permease protein
MLKHTKRRQQTREQQPPKNNKPVKPDARQNKAAGGGLADKLAAYRDLHAHVLFSSLGRLVAAPFTSIMTVTVLTITLSLASGFYLLLVNFQQLTSHLETSSQISLFLKESTSDAAAEKLSETIRTNPQVQHVTLISKEQALAEFKTYSGFGSAVSALKTNPLPIVIQVLPKNTLTDKRQLEALLHDLQQSVDVDLAQMDMEWLDRLQSIMSVGAYATGLINALLFFAVLFITANTIRLELHSRREEVIIAKLVGATDAFIRRPFLYAGAWIGFSSGVAAWFTVTGMMLILRSPVETLSALYGGHFHLLFFTAADSLELIGISLALGVAGAWAVLMYQLRYTKPE